MKAVYVYSTAVLLLAACRPLEGSVDAATSNDLMQPANDGVVQDLTSSDTGGDLRSGGADQLVTTDGTILEDLGISDFAIADLGVTDFAMLELPVSDMSIPDLSHPDFLVLDLLQPGLARPALAAWYRFEEASGPVTDRTGNGHNGTVYGTAGSDYTQGVAGKIGNAMAFNGGYVLVPSSPGLDFTNAAGVSFWLKVAHNSVTGGEQIFFRGRATYQVQVNLGGINGAFTFAVGSSSNYGLGKVCSVTTDMLALSVGQWTHVAWVDNGQDGMVYLNGQLKATAPGGCLGSLADDLYLGAAPGANPYPLYGLLDELKWWTVALTPQQVCAEAGGTWNGSTSTCTPGP